MKVLILVKTYPVLSVKYEELVCTAGILENGDWIRLYPIPFRRLEYKNRYKKYQWIKVNAQRSQSDTRPESYTPNIDNVEVASGKINTKNAWRDRKILIEKTNVYNDMSELIGDAKKNHTSLATFKPFKMIGCDFKEHSKDDLRKDEVKIKEILKRRRQLQLFSDNLKDLQEFIVKIPFKFYYIFQDINGKESRLSIIDWEIGQLYVNCYEKSQKTTEDAKKKEARDKVIEKLKSFIEEKDVYLFLGTTKQFHSLGRNPFVIIGLFYPPKSSQRALIFS